MYFEGSFIQDALGVLTTSKDLPLRNKRYAVNKTGKIAMVL